MDYAATAYANATADVKSRILFLGLMMLYKLLLMVKGGFNFYELMFMVLYLMDKGVFADSMLKDTAFMDIIGNVYYFLCLYVILCVWMCVEVVMSVFYMECMCVVFEWVWGFVLYGVVDMRFVSTEDVGVSEFVLRVRAKREVVLVVVLWDNVFRIIIMEVFLEWLFIMYKCYVVFC